LRLGGRAENPHPAPRHVSGIVEKGLLSQEAKALNGLELPDRFALGYQERLGLRNVNLILVKEVTGAL
jgi:hypothetical protein